MSNLSNWEELLTFLPNLLGGWWQATMSVLALLGAGILFFKMIVDEPFSALLVTRVGFGVSLLLTALKPLQPGWGPWAEVLFVLSSLGSSLLIATGWCHREDQSVSMGKAIARWIIARFDAMHLANRAAADRREDAL
jgi:hypothetical protein